MYVCMYVYIYIYIYICMPLIIPCLHTIAYVSWSSRRRVLSWRVELLAWSSQQFSAGTHADTHARMRASMRTCMRRIHMQIHITIIIIITITSDLTITITIIINITLTITITVTIRAPQGERREEHEGGGPRGDEALHREARGLRAIVILMLVISDT